MWIKKLVEDEKYHIGDTITCYLVELKNMPGKKTDNGVFKTEDESVININVPSWFNMTPGRYYDIHLKNMTNGFVQWDYLEVKGFPEISDDPNDYEDVIKLIESSEDVSLDEDAVSHRLLVDYLEHEIDVVYQRMKEDSQTLKILERMKEELL